MFFNYTIIIDRVCSTYSDCQTYTDIARHSQKLLIIVNNHTLMCSNTDDNHTDIGHIVIISD